jgi:GTP-binding protein EngB required for normal cell division
MQKKGILLVLTGILVIVGIIGLNYTSIENDIKKVVNSATISPSSSSQGGITKQSNLEEKDMIKLMEEYGFSNITQAIEKKDYEALDEFTNNMTDEDYLKMIDIKNNTTDADYQKMVDIMRENGYESMAIVMGSIDRGGACH